MKEQHEFKQFRVRQGASVRLKDFPTLVKPIYSSKEDYSKILHEHVKKLDHFQSLLYAHNRYALLLVFQGMDTSGKDGAIKHVLSGVNPAGCQVFSFKQPSSEELDHDFLWRASRALPERGRIGIFNRSYYEEVLIVRVHPEVLQSENLPEELTDPDHIWKWRFASIRDFEKHLFRSGTRVVKFFLHISKKEQTNRLLARINNPDKNWKLAMSDIHERQFWNEYQCAYEDAIGETSTDEAPWFIIPGDDKKNARLIISSIVLDIFKSLQMEFPTSTPAHQKELQQMAKLLQKEK
jgi:PPK2 family polyphosphate:nucleotide phosphotransferase